MLFAPIRAINQEFLGCYVAVDTKDMSVRFDRSFRKKCATSVR